MKQVTIIIGNTNSNARVQHASPEHLNVQQPISIVSKLIIEQTLYCTNVHGQVERNQGANT